MKKKRLIDTKFLSTPEGIMMSGDSVKFFLNVLGRSTRGYFDMQWNSEIIHFAWYNLVEQNIPTVQGWMDDLVRCGLVTPYVIEGITYAYVTAQITGDVNGFGYQYKDNRDGAPIVPLPDQGDSDANRAQVVCSNDQVRVRHTRNQPGGLRQKLVRGTDDRELSEPVLHGEDGKLLRRERGGIGEVGGTGPERVQPTSQQSEEEEVTSSPNQEGGDRSVTPDSKPKRKFPLRRKSNDHITATAPEPDSDPKRPTNGKSLRGTTHQHALVSNAQGGDLPFTGQAGSEQPVKRPWRQLGTQGLRRLLRKLGLTYRPQAPQKAVEAPEHTDPTRTTQEAPKVAQRSNEGASFAQQIETARAEITRAKKNSTFELQSFVKFPQDVLVKVFNWGTGPLNRDELLGIKDLR